MNSDEARAVLAEAIAEYRSKSYDDLKGILGRPQVSRRRGASGVEYQLEIEAFWDAGPGRDIRVVGAIDDGGLRAFVPIASDFIVAPDGRFVGE
jgi:hypothetical protein